MQYRNYLWLLAPLALLAGCGGGDSPSTSGESRTVDLYVTDDFSTTYSQVWATLYRIELSADNGSTFTPLFESTDGTPVNLAALRDVAQLLATSTLPEGEFNAVRVVFGDHLTLVIRDTGASQEVPVEAREHVRVADGKASVLLAPGHALLPRGAKSLVLDFDLASFLLVGGKLRPVILPSAPPNFARREHRAELLGTVQGLTTTGFTLVLPAPPGSRRSAVAIPVTLTDQTLISHRDGKDATLTEGARVLVRGLVHDTAGSRTLTAESIRLLPIAGIPAVESRAVRGMVSEVNPDEKSFTLTLLEATMRPTSASITVQTDEKTEYRADVPTFAPVRFGDIQKGGELIAFGTLSTDRKSLLASRIELHLRGRK